MTTTRDRYLEPYRSLVIDDGHADLMAALLEWCDGQCTCLEGVKPHVRHVVEAATFAYFCSPADTTADELLFLAKDTMIFFLADDGPRADREELRRFLHGSGPAGRGETSAWYRTLIAEMRAAGLRTADYDAASAEMLQAMAREQEVNPCRLPVAQFWAIRRPTFATGPFLACWVALRHRDLHVRAGRAWSELGLLTLAIDAMILTNDLGSLERDIRPRTPSSPANLNYVLIPHPGLASFDARVEAAIDLANRRLDQIEHRLALAEEAATAMLEPRLVERARFCVTLVSGNLDTTLHLSHRYPGAATRLRRLRRLD